VCIYPIKLQAPILLLFIDLLNREKKKTNKHLHPHQRIPSKNDFCHTKGIAVIELNKSSSHQNFFIVLMMIM
jgi:hypothetical protein